MKKKYESSSQDISTTLGAMGGDFDALMKLQGSGGKDTDENVTNWLKDQISDTKKTMAHDYPVVKLFNHIWMQEDYEKRMNNEFAYANPWLYSYDNINNMQVAGWQVPDVKAYEEMLAILSKYSSNCQPAIALGEGGVTGGYAQIKQTGEMLTNTVPYKDWYITVRLVATNLSH